MKHGIITISTSGKVHITLSADGTVWLTKGEIATLFNLSQTKIETNLKKLLSEGDYASKEERQIQEGKTYIVEYFDLDVVVALSFRIDSYVCTLLRRWFVKRITTVESKPAELYIQVGKQSLLN